MSNDCSNWIQIIGDKDVIARLFELVKSEERDWGKIPSPKLTEEENRKWLGLEFDFNRVIPYPLEFKVLDDAYEKAKAAGVPWGELPESGYKHGGYMWCLEHWGTTAPSNAMTGFIDQKEIEEVEGFRLSDYKNPACGRIYFATAWSPAYPVTETLSKQFPELSFKHYFEEFGMLGSGYKVWKAGILVAEHQDNIWDEQEEEEEAEEGVDPDEGEFGILHLTDLPDLGSANISVESTWNIKKLENGTLKIEKYLGKEASPTFPENVAIVGPSSFSGCTSLVSIVIPEGVKEIDNQAFLDCVNLSQISLPQSLKFIYWGAFQGCKKLSSVKLPQGLQELAGEVFSGCKKLTSVVIPDSVDYIGEGAFKNCTSLVSVTLLQGITSIGSHAFAGCSNLTSLMIPDGVTVIDVYAFEGCSSITSVIFPESMDQIWVGAFKNCTGLESVVIHARARIYDSAFDGCPRLVIHAPRGSSAFDYAKANRIPFIEG